MLEASGGDGMVERIRKASKTPEPRTYVTGQAAAGSDPREAAQESARRAEVFALPIALATLIAAFGGLVAAGIPALVGVCSVPATFGAVYVVGRFYEMSVFVTQVAKRLGPGPGIDYALLVVNRLREELGRHPVEEAVARTAGTAGRTISLSGAAVLIGLAGLFFFPLPVLRSIGIGGVLVVGMTVLAALTPGVRGAGPPRPQDRPSLRTARRSPRRRAERVAEARGAGDAEARARRSGGVRGAPLPAARHPDRAGQRRGPARERRVARRGRPDQRAEPERAPGPRPARRRRGGRDERLHGRGAGDAAVRRAGG